MKRKILPVLLIVVFVAAFMVVPAMAQGEQPPAPQPPLFDLAYIGQLLQALILATLPVLAAAGVRWLDAKWKTEKTRLNVEQLWALDLFIKTAVFAAEQMKASQFITDKLDYVTARVQEWLDAHQIYISADEIRARIEAAVKRELNPPALPDSAKK